MLRKMETTFEENALIKARAIMKITGEVTMLMIPDLR